MRCKPDTPTQWQRGKDRGNGRWKEGMKILAAKGDMKTDDREKNEN